MARFSSSSQPHGDGPGLLVIVRAVFVLVVALIVLAAIFHYGFSAYTDLGSPDIDPPTHELEVDRTGRTVRYGGSSLVRRSRLWQLHLEGPPEELGAGHGALAGRLFYRVDERVRSLAARRYAGWIDAWTAEVVLRWDFHDADQALGEQRRSELATLAQRIPSAPGARLGVYHRLFLYQCFDELAHELDDVFIEGAVFASGPRKGARAKAGSDPAVANLVIGRSFSLQLGRDFDVERVVTFYHPDGKYPFVSIGWAGLIGAVTGINARGIFVAYNPARSDEPSEKGEPITLVLRKILEEADTLEAAVETLKGAELRTAGIVLVGDGPQRKAAVVELSPRLKEDRRLVRGEDDPMVWATNHMVREAFERDAQNERIRRYTSSGHRHDRLAELLEESGPLDPERAAQILRDRDGVGHTELGLGNRNALENLRISHAVIVDATAMVLWVAEGPSALGRFRAIDLNHRLRRTGERPAPLDDIAADRLLHSEELSDYQEALVAVDHARALLTGGQPESALSSAKVALALAPDIADLHRLLGDIERELGDNESALTHYQRYLELVPGRLRDQERVRGLITELGG